MLTEFLKGFRELSNPQIGRLIALSLLLAAVSFAVLWIGVGFLLAHTRIFEQGWLEGAVDVVGGLGTLAVSWLLFPAVFGALVGFLVDGVADVVEHRHYPSWPRAREQTLGEIAGSTLRFLGTVLLANIALLFFLIIPPVYPFMYYGVNGFLFGREYFEVVAFRHVNPAMARTLWRKHRPRLFVTGVIIAFLMTVPFLNFLAPIVATVTMVHLWARIRTAA